MLQGFASCKDARSALRNLLFAGRRNRRIGRRGVAMLRASKFVMIGSALLHLSAQVSFAQFPERYQPSGVKMRLWDDASYRQLTFGEYSRAAFQAIAKYHWRDPQVDADAHVRRMEQIAPRQWDPRDGCTEAKTEGVLLVHGLSDSPFHMRDIGDAISRGTDRCRLVRSILLPGHATVPGDLTVATFEDWIAAVRWGISSFSGVVTKLHLVGFSTGGALILYEALAPHETDGSPPLASLSLISPAIRPAGILGRLTLTPRLLYWTSRITGYQRWLDQHDDLDFAKYESFPIDAGYQLFLLDEKLHALLNRDIPIPTFVILSIDDATVDARTSVSTFLKRANSASRLIVVARNPSDPFADETRADPRVTFFDGYLPERGINSFAHTSFVNRMANPHYGLDGDYADCLAYDSADKVTNASEFCSCISPAMKLDRCTAVGSGRGKFAILYGEKSATNSGTVVRRLTFNPYFEQMISAMQSVQIGKP